MRSLPRAGLVLLAFALLAAGCGGDDDKQARQRASGSDPQSLSYKDAKQQLKLADAERGEVSIRNRFGATVKCDVPGYLDGRKFEVEPSASKWINASDVDRKKIVDVTCGDQRVSNLNITPDSEGAELEYVDETTFRQRGYVYVHSHLDATYYQCQGSEGGSRRYDWAVERSGSCEGFFLEGSPPYVGHPFGATRWERLGGSDRPRGAPNDLVIMVRNSLLDDDRRVERGTTIECYIFDRGSPDCYTDYRFQQGKPAGTEGGPLRIDAHLDGKHGDYLFIRGFCRKGDPMCTPH